MISEKNAAKRLGHQLFFTGPTILAFSAVIIIPFIYGIYLTFFEWDGIANIMPFVGIDNYVAIFHDDKFWKSILLTLKFVVTSVILINVVAFFLAYAVTSGIKGQNFFRTVFFVPNLIGLLVLGFLWQFLLNRFFVSLGEKYALEIFQTSWLGDEQKAFWALVIVTVWQSAGYMMVILIAGLMNVPKDIIEAATIDGASNWTRLTRMIIPLMIPAFVVTIFLTLRNGFLAYDVNLALTNGGPFGTTIMAPMHIYNKAFQAHNYGLGQAEAFLLFFMVAGVTILQVYFSKKLEVEA